MPMDDTAGSITEPQVKYLESLVKQKDLNHWRVSPEQREYLLAGDYSAMSKLRASKAINLLLACGDKPPEPVEIEQRLPEGATSDAPFEVIAEGEVVFPTTTQLDLSDADIHVIIPDTNIIDASGKVVPVTIAPPVRGLEPTARELLAAKLTQLESEVEAGYYFIVNPALANGKAHDPNDGERFYHVSKGADGSRWAGYTFIESRGGDFLYKVRDMQARIDILTEIKKDPITAMNEYGIRLGVCGCCGRTLTAKDSRLRGLGPICAAKILGAPSPEQVDLLYRLGLKK